MRLFEKLKTQPHFIAFCMSIVILLIDLPSAFAQTKSGNVDGLATKLPSKTVLQMGLSAKDSKSAPKSSQQNSAIKPKPRPEAKWGKSKDPVNIKGNRTKTESKSNKISTSKIYPAPKATVKPQNPTSNRPSLTKPASLPKPVGQVSQPIKKLPEPITEAKKLKTTSTPDTKTKKLPAPISSKSKKAELLANGPQNAVTGLKQILGKDIFAIAIFLGFLLIFAGIMNAFAYSRLFKMAGYPGWAVFVPFYNIYVHITISGLPTWALVGYFIPYINGFMPLIAQYRFAKAYGKNQSYCMFFAVFNPIMAPFLAMSNTTAYVGSASSNFRDPHQGMKNGSGMNQPLAVSMMRPGAGMAALSQGHSQVATNKISKIG